MSDSKNRFYDIHMHVFNLSHAGLMAFINRFFLNNALDFNDLLKGRYLKILRYYFFKKGHSIDESRKIIRRRRFKVSLRIILILAWAVLWFYFIPQYLYFSFDKICPCWGTIFSWVVYVTGFVFSPIVLFVLYLLVKWPIKKLFSKKAKSKSLARTINVLSIFENDLAHQLRYIEMDYMSKHKCIRDYIASVEEPEPIPFYKQLKILWDAHGSKVKINGQSINKVILTPLMMNFNSKGFEKLDKSLVHYNIPPAKLIIEQLVDLFNGIQNYCKKGLNLGLLEVYPLMGVNPSTYRKGGAVYLGQEFIVPETLAGKVVFLPVPDILVFVKKLEEDEKKLMLDSIVNEQLRTQLKKVMDEFHDHNFKKDGFPVGNTFPKMLEKYFGDYHGDADEFSETFKKTFLEPEEHKTWRDIRSNFFCGIKVYPPLGFDPYPCEELPENENTKAASLDELARMEEEHFNIRVNTHYLYWFCTQKNIPLTTHCSDGGFVIMDERWSRERANPEYWAGVLHFYPKLKLNFGHFGVQLRSTKNGWGDWNKTIIRLILNDDFPNVYADISDLGADLKGYKLLGKAIDEGLNSWTTDEDKIQGAREKLYQNLLFGTDFMVNLFHTDSYLAYLNTWEETGIFYQKDKRHMACDNPHRFLFGD